MSVYEQNREGGSGKQHPRTRTDFGRHGGAHGSEFALQPRRDRVTRSAWTRAVALRGEDQRVRLRVDAGRGGLETKVSIVSIIPTRTFYSYLRLLRLFTQNAKKNGLVRSAQSARAGLWLRPHEFPLLPSVSHDWDCRYRDMQTFRHLPSSSSRERPRHGERWRRLTRLRTASAHARSSTKFDQIGPNWTKLECFFYFF